LDSDGGPTASAHANMAARWWVGRLICALAVIKVPATGDRIGMLMVNPGGPGASAVDTVAGMGAALSGTDIGRRFDLVGVDPRGIGYSTGCGPWCSMPRLTRASFQSSKPATKWPPYGEFTGFAPRDVCAMWRVPPTSAPHPASSPGPGKVVVVSTIGDPATPYQAGVVLARQMGAPLITFDGAQHTVVFNGDACVDTAVVNFFVDSTVPPDGLRC
jgi:hypothetical protein